MAADAAVKSTSVLEFLHATDRRTLSGGTAGNAFPSNVRTFASGEAKDYGEGVLSLGIDVGAAGLIFIILVFVIYCMALCCNRFGGDRTKACCCRSKKPLLQRDALSAPPTGAFGGQDPLGGPGASPPGFGTAPAAPRIRQAELNKPLLIAMGVLIVVYLGLCSGVYTGIVAMGTGVNGVADGVGGVAAVLSDLGGIVSDAAQAVDSLGRSVTTLGDEVHALPTPGSGAVAATVYAAGEAVTAGGDLLDSGAALIGQFRGNIRDNVDTLQGYVTTYAQQAGLSYATALAVSIIALGVTMMPLGMCTCLYKLSVPVNLCLMLVLWSVTALLMMVAAAGADVCLAGPSANLVSLVNSTGAPAESVDTLAYYIQCTGNESPVGNPNFTAPGLYGTMVQFYRQSELGTGAVLGATRLVRSDAATAAAARVQPMAGTLAGVEAGVGDVRNITGRLVELAGCASLGGRIYNPVVGGICNGIIGEGLASLWAVHMAMCAVLTALMLLGVFLCNGNAHPGGAAARDRIKRRELGTALFDTPGAMGPPGAGISQVNPVVGLPPPPPMSAPGAPKVEMSPPKDRAGRVASAATPFDPYRAR